MAEELIRRFGRGTSKQNQKSSAKLLKKLANGLNVKDKENVPKRLIVVIAELCSNDVENPIHADPYTIKPVWQAVKQYLSDQADTLFSSAIVDIFNGIDLPEEEEKAIKASLQ